MGKIELTRHASHLSWLASPPLSAINEAWRLVQARDVSQEDAMGVWLLFAACALDWADAAAEYAHVRTAGSWLTERVMTTDPDQVPRT